MHVCRKTFNCYRIIVKLCEANLINKPIIKRDSILSSVAMFALWHAVHFKGKNRSGDLSSQPSTSPNTFWHIEKLSNPFSGKASAAVLIMSAHSSVGMEGDTTPYICSGCACYCMIRNANMSCY